MFDELEKICKTIGSTKAHINFLTQCLIIKGKLIPKGFISKRRLNTLKSKTAMIKIRCKMASIQNEENASKELDFKTQTEDGIIRNPTIKEEFVKVIKEFKILVKKVFTDSILEEYF